MPALAMPRNPRRAVTTPATLTMLLVSGLLATFAPAAADAVVPAAAADRRGDPTLALPGKPPAARRVEVRSQYAALTVRPAGQPTSARLADRFAGVEVRTDIYRSSAGRAYSVTAGVTMQAGVPYSSPESPADYFVIGLGQGTAENCAAESYLIGEPTYETTTYAASGYFADGTAAVPPATVWTCATAYTANDLNGDGSPLGEQPLDQVSNVLGNTLGSETLVLPGESRRKVVRNAWTGLAIPVANRGSVAANRVILTARGRGARVRVNRVLASLDVGETDYVPIEVKLRAGTGKVSFAVASADGVSARSGTLTLTRAKAPKRPTTGRYQSTAGGDVRWKINRRRKLSGFSAPVKVYCDGNLNPFPKTIRLPAFKVPRHGVVSKTFKDGLFTNELYLTIKGDNVPYGYFARYTDGALTGQQACSGNTQFTAKWIGR